MNGSAQPIYLAGPTASGKSAVAVALAQQLNGEILSVDSMQVYRGLDIGTAKPSAEERRGIPHHLIDVVDVAEPFDAARFIELARAVEREVIERGAVPIYCGGTGLYFKALLHGVGEAPSPDPNLRLSLEQTPLPALLEELERSDPTTFGRIDRNNPRRVVRALEVIRLSGRSFSEQQSEWNDAGEPVPTIFALERANEDLRARINVRVDAMFEQGLVPETQSLLASGLEQNRTAMQAIGYRQVVEHLRGERSLADTITLIKSRTWQLARRQMTWLRNQLNPVWIRAAADTAAVELAGKIRPLIGS